MKKSLGLLLGVFMVLALCSCGQIDRYGTEPQQKPAEGQAENAVCHLTIDCGAIFTNLDQFDADKTELLPADGVILDLADIPFEEGDTVLDLLKTVARDQALHIELSETPGFGTSYIKGIQNIYEQDCGDMSGWLYAVNGQSPSVGISQFVLSPNDQINILYSCDGGQDIGLWVAE